MKSQQCGRKPVSTLSIAYFLLLPILCQVGSGAKQPGPGDDSSPLVPALEPSAGTAEARLAAPPSSQELAAVKQIENGIDIAPNGTGDKLLAASVSASRSADAANDTSADDPSADPDLAHIEKRMLTAKKGIAGLKKRLAGNIRVDQKLLNALKDMKKAAIIEKVKAKEELATHVRRDVAAVDRMQKRERDLDKELQNVTRVSNKRAHTLVRMNQTLTDLEKERVNLLRKLSTEINHTWALGSTYRKEMTKEKDLRHKLESSVNDVSIHVKAEARERQAEHKIQQEIEAKTSEVKAAKSALVKQLDVNSHEDATLNTTQRELKASKALGQQQQDVQQDKENRIRELLGKEQEAEERALLLSQELEVQTQLAKSERAHEKQMGHLVAALRDSVRKQVSNLTWKIGVQEASAKQLKEENKQMTEQLRQNATQINQYQAEVNLLKKRMDDGDKARQRAEASLAGAEAAKASEEAISKQLSGTVPRLMEQTQMAREAVDAEKAMRMQASAAQAAAQTEVVGLEREYSTAVQGELESINQALPQLGTPPTGDTTQGGAAKADQEDQALTDQALAPLGGDTVSTVSDTVTDKLSDAVSRAATATAAMTKAKPVVKQAEAGPSTTEPAAVDDSQDMADLGAPPVAVEEEDMG